MSYNPNTGKIDPSWQTILGIHDIFNGDNTEKDWQEILAQVKILPPNSFLKQDFNGNTIAHLVMIKFVFNALKANFDYTLFFKIIEVIVYEKGFTKEISPINKCNLKVDPNIIYFILFAMEKSIDVRVFNKFDINFTERVILVQDIWCLVSDINNFLSYKILPPKYIKKENIETINPDYKICNEDMLELINTIIITDWDNSKPTPMPRPDQMLLPSALLVKPIPMPRVDPKSTQVALANAVQMKNFIEEDAEESRKKLAVIMSGSVPFKK
jgi:hypothetical protein